MTVPSLCPVGYFCAINTGSDWDNSPCPEGSFNDRDGLRSIEDCQDLGHGKFGETGDSEGFVTREQGTRCTAGYTCYWETAAIDGDTLRST